jgi:hypothetical protein
MGESLLVESAPCQISVTKYTSGMNDENKECGRKCLRLWQVSRPYHSICLERLGKSMINYE